MSYNPNENSSNWSSMPNNNDVQDQDPMLQGPEKYLTSKLSRDELRVLKECNAESFYYRCVPFSTVFSGLAYIAMKNGHLKKSPSYGYIPKMCAGAIIGYIVGKVSYQGACAEKMIRLPNSTLAEALKKRRGQPSFQESVTTESEFAPISPSKEFAEDTIFDDRRPDLSDHNDGMDGFNTVTENLSPYSETTEEKSPRNTPYVTYEDLRKKNREEYATKMAEKYRRQTPEPTRPPADTPSSFPGSGFPEASFSSQFPNDSSSNRGQSPPPPAQPTPYFNPKKNKYGDTWD